jgi:hypothetical protein
MCNHLCRNGTSRTNRHERSNLFDRQYDDFSLDKPSDTKFYIVTGVVFVALLIVCIIGMTCMIRRKQRPVRHGQSFDTTTSDMSGYSLY